MILEYIHDHFLKLIAVVVVFFVIDFIIATIEGFRKQKLLYEKSNQTGLIIGAVFAFISVVILFFMLSDNNRFIELLPIVIIAIKLFMSIWIATQASKLGRNAVLWWFLSFVEYHSAMIALAVKLPLSKDSINTEEINQKYSALEKELKALKKQGILDDVELTRKLSNLRDEYFKEYESQIHEVSQKSNSEFESKLKKAYEDGLLTKEEFDRKSGQTNSR